MTTGSDPLEDMLDIHAATDPLTAPGSTPPPPPAFLAAVRQRRRTRIAARAGGGLAIVAVLAASIAMLVQRPSALPRPAIHTPGDSIAATLESQLEHLDRAHIGAGSLHVRGASAPVDPREELFLRPGTDTTSVEVEMFLASI